MSERLIARSVVASLVLIAAPSMALAHAADQGFILLLPTDIYITAAVTAFALTVVLVALLPSGASERLFRAQHLTRWRGPRWPETCCSLLATAAFFGLATVGILGPRDPLSNLLPLMIWSIWWIGFVALHMLFGDLWRWINPWAGLARVVFGPEHRGLLRLPRWFGVWPAIGIFLLFTSFSIADSAPYDPDRLARFALGYWLFTFAGMGVFGARDWGRHCECFNVFFSLLSDLAPLRTRQGISLGTPGWRVIHSQNAGLSTAIFCLAFLGAGSFDGLNETFWWLAQIGVNPLDFQGRSTIVSETILGFLGSILLLIALFAACVWLGVQLAGGTRPPVRPLFQRLAYSLVPIGLGFHVAHFLTSFLVTAQYARVALTDPMATGANLLGLSDIRVYVGFLRDSEVVRVIWLSQAAVVVLSHVIAVLIAHGVIRQVYPDRHRAWRAELPLSVFMVLYTLFGLWLLAAARGA